MNIANLNTVLKFFGRGELNPEEKLQLVKEALLMTLARASDSDSNIHPVEVDTVREIVKKITGDDVSAADVRVAAGSEIFETTPLEQCLARMSSKLTTKDRALIANSLADVIRSDVRITSREVEFFGKVASALRITPAELAGLIPDEA